MGAIMSALQRLLDLWFARWEYGNRMVEAYLADWRGDGVARAEAENSALEVEGRIARMMLQ